MTNAISSAYREASAYWSDGAEAYCKTADTVISGALCDELTVVSNACRSPSTAVDAFVCDDRQMGDLQTSIWGTVRNLVFTILGVRAGKP